jgi:hypothetical protein
VPKTDASTHKKKVLVGDDTEDGGVSSTELVAPNRPVPVCWSRPIPPPSIELPQLFLLLVGTGEGVPHLLLGGANLFI